MVCRYECVTNGTNRYVSPSKRRNANEGNFSIHLHKNIPLENCPYGGRLSFFIMLTSRADTLSVTTSSSITSSHQSPKLFLQKKRAQDPGGGTIDHISSTSVTLTDHVDFFFFGICEETF